MRWRQNTTAMRERSRRLSPQPGSQLSVEAGSDLETKKSRHPARVFRDYVSYDSTHTAAAAASAAAAAACHSVGLGCLVEKYHVKRLGTALPGQTRVS